MPKICSSHLDEDWSVQMSRETGWWRKEKQGRKRDAVEEITRIEHGRHHSFHRKPHIDNSTIINLRPISTIPSREPPHKTSGCRSSYNRDQKQVLRDVPVQTLPTTKVSVRTRFGTQKKARRFKERVQRGTPLRNRAWVR